MSHQNPPSFESKKIRYASADTPNLIYKQIRQGAEKYFTVNKLPKHATAFMAYKAAVLVALIMGSHWSLTQLETFGGALAVYFVLGFASLILSINLGHDAAHHAVTGVKRTDDFIFQTIFALQGLSGYVWQMRHNYSHHVLPNVKKHDTDLEITNLILFEPNTEIARWYHRYQHIYAPFLYAFTSFHLLFVQDFKFFLQKDHANLHFERIPVIEWVKMLSFKVLYFGLTFGLPMAFGSLDFLQVVAAWAMVHMSVSVFVAFTFFISHHVQELDYVDSGANHDLISDSWIHHQITTTIDFEPDNAFANFLFGGFNLHVAHHVFPEISHEHYPAMTRMIRQVLADNNVSDWYKSFSFTEGCASHLKHLKNIAEKAFADDAEEEIDFNNAEPITNLSYENV
ncbi:MAG: acyl-CoA desaturase [Saprospiraceae bacterium]|nr:acyl-CoA desaturase [Saprospiraceae bacterium]